MPTAFPLPADIEGISPEWLTAALSIYQPGAVVRQVKQLTTIHGSATKIRLGLDYQAGTQGKLPETMWIKIGLEPHSAMIDDTGLYSVETICYAKLLPAFDLPGPKSYFAAEQDNPHQCVMLLEDLLNRGVTFNVATRPLNVAQAAAGLDTLAEIHAKTWNAEGLEQFGLRPLLSGSGVGIFTGAMVEDAEQYYNAPRGGVLPASMRDQKRLAAGYARYLEHSTMQKPICFLHGDTHVGNTFLESNGSIGFLDWQCAAFGHWAHDVGYFLVSAITTEDRRAGDRDLIAGYLKALKRHGVEPPGFDDAWESYRRSLIYGFVIWLGNPDSMQPPEVNQICLERFSAAMIDHDGFGVHGV